MDPITLQPGEHVDVVVGGRTVRVRADQDGVRGDHSVALSGVDCDLDGEMPGLYYIVPRDTAWHGGLQAS